jgi:hypothetical protein
MPYESNGLWGFKDKASGNIIVSPKYDFADYLFAKGVAKVSKWKKIGLINKFGKEVVPCKYDDIQWNLNTKSYFSDDNESLVKLAGKYGLIDENGVETVPCIYKSIELLSNNNKYFNEYGLAKVQSDAGFGLINKSGKIITPCKYTDLSVYSKDSLAAVNIKYQYYGYIDYTGKEIIPCIYDDIKTDYEFENYFFVSKNNKHGIYTKNGKAVLPCTYDTLRLVSQSIEFIANGKHGLLDDDGNILIPCQYEFIDSYSSGYCRVKKAGKYGFVNDKGIEAIKCNYDEIVWNQKLSSYFSSDKISVKKDGKYGVIDLNEKIIVPFQYDWEVFLPVFTSYSEIIKNGLKGAIDQNGKEIIPCKYDELSWDYDVKRNKDIPSNLKGKSLFTALYQGKWGVLDNSDSIVIPFKYDDLDNFTGGLAAASLAGKWGYINMNDDIAIPFKYDYCEAFDNDCAIAGYYKYDTLTKATVYKFGLINKKGKELLPFNYNITYDKKNNVFLFYLKEKTGVADSNGTVLIEPEQSMTVYFDSYRTEGMIKAWSKENNKYGFYSAKGKLVIPFLFDDAADFYEGIAAVGNNLKWGAIDNKGKVVVPLKYDAVDNFSSGLAMVKYGVNYGYVDKTGLEVIPLKYYSASAFLNGYARVMTDENSYGLIDKSDKIIIPASQEEIKADNSLNSYFVNGLAVVKSNGSYGYYNQQGTLIIPCKYTAAGFFENNRAAVKDNSKKFYYITKSGNKAFAATYDKAYRFCNNKAFVKSNNSFQIIDTLGKVLKTLPYDEILPGYNWPSAVKLDKRWGYINEIGNEIIPLKFDWADTFKNGVAEIEVDGARFLINIDGDIIGEGSKK